MGLVIHTNKLRCALALTFNGVHIFTITATVCQNTALHLTSIKIHIHERTNKQPIRASAAVSGQKTIVRVC